jgi:hypothetical protein
MESIITSPHEPSDNPMQFLLILSILLGGISIYNLKPTLDIIFIFLAIIGAGINIYLGCKKIFKKKHTTKIN